MYAEISVRDVEDLKPCHQEGHVYTVSRFMVSKNMRGYRPVKGDLMINFTCHTTRRKNTLTSSRSSSATLFRSRSFQASSKRFRALWVRNLFWV